MLDAVGTYEVNGRILDKDGGQTTYTTTITVDPPPNAAPVADAGADQEVNAGDTVTLDGTGIDRRRRRRLDLQLGADRRSRRDADRRDHREPTFTAPTGPATLTFELTVDDGDGGTDTDTVTITVNGIPTADAGPDQAVNLGDTVTLDGTGSTDPDGDDAGLQLGADRRGTVVTSPEPTRRSPPSPRPPVRRRWPSS